MLHAAIGGTGLGLAIFINGGVKAIFEEELHLGDGVGAATADAIEDAVQILLDGFADADFNHIQAMPSARCAYRFEAIPTGTRATYTSTYTALEDLEKVLAMGVEEGATLAINQIDALLAEVADEA